MSGQLVAPDLQAQHASPQFGIGEKHWDDNGDLWEYAKNEGGCSAGHFCLLDNAGDATALTTTNAGSVGQKVGVADIAMTDEYYGWYWRGGGEGNFTAIIANAVAAGTQLTSTGTSGVAGTGGVALDGCRATALGVTSTRVAIHAAVPLVVGVAAAAD